VEDGDWEEILDKFWDQVEVFKFQSISLRFCPLVALSSSDGKTVYIRGSFEDEAVHNLPLLMIHVQRT
jgi:hypothetical protein